MTTQCHFAFSRPGDAQRYATKQFPIDDKDRMRMKLPADSFDVKLIVHGAIDAKREWELDPGAYPDGAPQGPYFVLSEKGQAEVREIARAAWIESGGNPEKFDAMHQAAMRALAIHDYRRDKASQFALALEAPADYDDSEIALGKQRLAQLERLAEYEARERDLSDV